MFALGTQATYFISQVAARDGEAALHRTAEARAAQGLRPRHHFTPTYGPWDQRLCVDADGGLFKAIRDGKASVVTDHIDTFTETGIRLQSGEELEADIIVTATGLEVLFIGGIEVTGRRREGRRPERLTYKGMMLEGVPNIALAIGYTNASWTLKCDLTCGYVTKLLNHMRDTGLRQCTPVANGSDRRRPGTRLRPAVAATCSGAAHLLPKQGAAFPWQVKQSYLADYRAMRLKRIDDEYHAVLQPGPRTRGHRFQSRGAAVKDFNGRVAAITGAASGIGRALAIDLAGRGAHLALERRRRGRPGRDGRPPARAAA